MANTFLGNNKIGFGITYNVGHSLGINEYKQIGITYPGGIDALAELVKKCGLLMSHEPVAQYEDNTESYAKQEDIETMFEMTTTPVDGTLEDKLGDETRPNVFAKYILGDGNLKASLDLPNTGVVYIDIDTLTNVNDTTDGNGDFTFPLGVKVGRLSVPSTGDIFYLQEGTGNTIADSINGRVAKLSSTPTFTDTTKIESRANQVGYTVSNGQNYAWDEALTDVVFEDVIIPNLTDELSVAYYSEEPIIDPIILAMQTANATMYIDGDSAGGLGVAGVNSPLTNPWQDLINEVGKNKTSSTNIIASSDGNATTGTLEGESCVTWNCGTGANDVRIPADGGFKANTQYTLSGKMASLDGGFVRIVAHYTDATTSSFQFNNTVLEAKTFTTDAGKTVDYISGTLTSSGRDLYVQSNTLQLEEGTSATAYEVYAKNNSALVNFAGTTSSGYDEVIVNQTNDVVNYDFRNGFDGFGTQSTTESTSNNESVLTASVVNPSIGMNITDPALTATDVYFIGFTITALDANAINFKTRIGSNAPVQVATPTVGVPFDIYEIRTYSSGTTGFRYESTAIGAQAEVEGSVDSNGGVFLFNLTDLDSRYPAMNLLTKTAEEINDMKYDLLALQNIVTMLKADGVDDYCTIADASSLDPTGTEDFAICVVIKTNSSLQTGFVYAKAGNNGGGNFNERQYALAPFSNGSVHAYLQADITVVPNGSLQTNTVHEILLKRIGGNLIVELDGVETYNQPNTTNLTSREFFKLFTINDSDGDVFYSNVFLGMLAFFYNGATGLNETDVDNACALAKAKYFA